MKLKFFVFREIEYVLFLGGYKIRKNFEVCDNGILFIGSERISWR